MEFPHLTLFLRRLRAPAPPDATVWQALHTPRARFLVTCLVWGLLPFYALANQNPLANRLLAQYGINTFLDPVVLLVVFCGNLLVYFTLAAAAQQLMGEPGRHAWPRLSPPDQPHWFATSLPNWNALLGVFLGGLLAVAPVIVGLPVFLALQMYGALTAAPQFGLLDGATVHQEWGMFWWANACSTLRLPHFFLACCCVSLALRRSPLWAYVPLAMSCAGAFTAGFGLERWDRFVRILNNYPFGPDGSAAFLCICCGALLLICGTAALARWLTQQSSPHPAGFGLLLGIGVIPLLATLASALASPRAFDYYTSSVRQFSAGIHAFFATFLPDMQAFTLRVNGQFNAVDFYGWQFDLLQGLQLALFSYCLTLVLWALAASQCLDAARGGRIR